MIRTWCSLALVLALAGCSGGGNGSGTGAAGTGSTSDMSGAAASGKKYTIAVIPKGTTHEFWKSVHYGAMQAAKELGGHEILWEGPLKEDDREGQINVVETMVTRGVDAICVAPLDSQALIAPVEQARAQNIPVVIFDSALDAEELIVSYVATDNYVSGQLAARKLGTLMNGAGAVVLMRYSQGSESTEKRENGFLDTIKQEFPQIKILSSDQYSGTTPESSLDKAQDLLQTFGEQVTGLFTVCEPNTTGMLQALEDKQLAGKVKFIGFDPAPRFIAALAERKMDGIVLQDPVKMGYLTVATAIKHLRGERVEKRIPTGEHIATPDNMETPEIKTLLSPPQ